LFVVIGQCLNMMTPDFCDILQVSPASLVEATRQIGPIPKAASAGSMRPVSLILAPAG
jgi:hypothetical protein